MTASASPPASPAPPHWMGFDIYAMVKPKTPQDYLQLLEEARRELDNIDGHLKTIERALTTRGTGAGDGLPDKLPQ